MKIYNKTKRLELPFEIERADTFFSRFLGLMFKKDIPSNRFLLLYPGNMIHTCFMNFSIDAAFISKDMKIIAVIEDMKPWRFSKMYRGAYYVLESKSSSMKNFLSPQDELSFM